MRRYTSGRWRFGGDRAPVVRAAVLLAISFFAFEAWGFACFVCGSRIANTILTVVDQATDDRREICEQCYQLKERCFMCALPVKSGLVQLEDGRTYCARDAQDSVLDSAEARRVCEAGYEDLNRLLIRHMEFPWKNVEFGIVGWAEMRQILQTPGLDRVCPSTIGYTRSFRTLQGDWRHTVRVLGGRRRDEMQAVLAHELGHTWLFENVNPRQRLLDRYTAEGFCELIAHQFMQQLGAERELKQIERNPYSQGQVNLFIAAEKEYGMFAVLQWVRYGIDPSLNGEDPDRIRRIAEPVPSASTNSVRPPSPQFPQVFPIEPMLTGISGSGKGRLALINDRSLGAGETGKVRVGTTNISVRCVEIGGDSVRIRIEGEETDRELRLKSKTSP